MLAASALPRRVATSMKRLVSRGPFESAAFVIAAIYIALHLSGSSYALALGELGEREAPLAGQPRGIRTDEWAVTTPLFQIAVNNDFRETNDTSFYEETLRNHIGLPLRNWAIIFKPLVWPFFVVSPELAYSFYWGANAALMLIGWSFLLRTFGFSRVVAGFTSTLLYFSPFIQAWSGPAPHLSLFPWVMLALVRITSPTRVALALALLIPTWWISMFFLSGLVPLFFLGLAMCLAFRPEVFAWRRLAGVVVGAVVGAAIAFVYFAPVLRAYADSVYPGNRWASGGDLPFWQVVSQFLPGTTTEGFTNLVAPNISEAATVATWLPLLAICFLDVGSIRRRIAADDVRTRCDVRRISVLLLMWGVLTLWQLVPVPPLSYAFGLGFSPGGRTLFASGALLLIAAAYAIDRLPIRFSARRLGVFSTVVIVAWIVASYSLQPSNALVVRDELLVLLLAGAAAAFALVVKTPSPNAGRIAILGIALFPVVLGWGWFNPLQSTRVMFRKPDTKLTRELDALAATREDGAIAVMGVADAILNGVGYRSVTHVIVTPSPQLFRPYFPEMDERTFNTIFNRFTHVSLTRRQQPFVAQDDVIRVPIRTMADHAATR